MARYGEAFRNRVVARLLPLESANAGLVTKEIGVAVQTFERRREGGRVEAVIADFKSILTRAGRLVYGAAPRRDIAKDNPHSQRQKVRRWVGCAGAKVTDVWHCRRSR
jgi:hypothetical protein